MALNIFAIPFLEAELIKGQNCFSFYALHPISSQPVWHVLADHSIHK